MKPIKVDLSLLREQHIEMLRDSIEWMYRQSYVDADACLEALNYLAGTSYELKETDSAYGTGYHLVPEAK